MLVPWYRQILGWRNLWKIDTQFWKVITWLILLRLWRTIVVENRNKKFYLFLAGNEKAVNYWFCAYKLVNKDFGVTTDSTLGSNRPTLGWNSPAWGNSGQLRAPRSRLMSLTGKYPVQLGPLGFLMGQLGAQTGQKRLKQANQIFKWAIIGL